VTAFASLNASRSIPAGEIVLKDLIPRPRDLDHGRHIMGQTASYFGCPSTTLCRTSGAGARHGPAHRHVLCRELTDLSLPRSASSSAAATTPRHQRRQEDRSLMAERRSIYTQVTELTNRIKQQARTS